MTKEIADQLIEASRAREAGFRRTEEICFQQVSERMQELAQAEKYLRQIQQTIIAEVLLRDAIAHAVDE